MRGNMCAQRHYCSMSREEHKTNSHNCTKGLLQLHLLVVWNVLACSCVHITDTHIIILYKTSQTVCMHYIVSLDQGW